MTLQNIFRLAMFPTLTALVFLLNQIFLNSQYYLLKELRYFLLYLIMLMVLTVEYFSTPQNTRFLYKNFWRDLLWVSICVIGVDWIFGNQFRILTLAFFKSIDLPGRLFPSSDLGSFWQQVLGYFMLVNLLKYWAHRLIHKIDFLWRFHALHHSIKEFYTLNSIYNHPFDYFIRVVVPTFFSWYVGWRFDAIFTGDCFAILIIWVSHSSTNFKYPRFLHYLITTNDVHHWHHHPRIGITKNFSTSVSLYDVIFGSFFLPKDGSKPKEVGLYRKTYYPQKGFWSLLFHPFKSSQER